MRRTYVDVGIEHVLKVLGRDGGNLVDQVHQETAHAVICCHLARLRQMAQHRIKLKYLTYALHRDNPFIKN